MANFSAVSSEVFTILRSFDYVLDLYDDKSNKVYEPSDARKFFASRTKHGKTQNLLVVIEDLNESSIIQLNTGPSSDSVALSGFWEAIKTCATKYNMTYSLVTHDKEIHPKNFAAHSVMQEGRNMIDLTENMYGTSRSSYLRIGEAKMIVRHNKRIDDAVPGARKRCVEHIFIENAHGERHMMPHNNLAAGRAMGQHVNQGGSWADDTAQQINNMADHFSDLGSSVSYLGSDALMEAMSDLRGKCKSRRKAIRETFNRIFREDTYAGEVQKLSSQGEPPLLEGSGLEKLREQMTIEGRKLPENVLNACARVLAETDCADENVLDEEVKGADEVEEIEDDVVTPKGKTISVLGVPVNAEAWEAFKSEGKLELRGEPKMSGQPSFKNVTAQVMFKMHSLTSVVVDDSMRELLEKVYDDYVSERLPASLKERGLISKLAVFACRAANIPIVSESTLGPRGVVAIVEMEEWFAKFNPNHVLLEMDCEKEIKDHMADYHSKESDTDDEHKSDHARIEPECEEEVGDHLKKYHADMVKENDELDEELTQEDILLPKNQGLDLADEVVAEPEGDDEMRRMLALAGRPQATPLGENSMSNSDEEDDDTYGDWQVIPSKGSLLGNRWDVEHIPTRKRVILSVSKKAAHDSAKWHNDGKPNPN